MFLIITSPNVVERFRLCRNVVIRVSVNGRKKSPQIGFDSIDFRC